MALSTHRRADRKQQALLGKNNAQRGQQPGGRVPGFNRFRTGAVDFHDLEATPLAQFAQAGKPHVETTEIKLRHVLGNGVDGKLQLRRDVQPAVGVKTTYAR